MSTKGNKKHNRPRYLNAEKSFAVLEKAFGFEQALEFCKENKGTQLFIPYPSTIIRRQRNAEILIDFRNGISVQELSRKYDLSETMLIRILEQLGEKWKDADQEQTRIIECAVCGEKFRAITPAHLATHGLTLSEYIENYDPNIRNYEWRKKQYRLP